MTVRSPIFLCALLLLAGAAPAEVALEKPSTFGNASLQLPRGWTVVEAGSDRFKAKAPQADKDPAGPSVPTPRDAGEFFANVNIKVTGEGDLDAQQKTLEKSGFPNYRRVEEPTAVSIGGAKGITFGGTFVVGKVPVRTRLYLLTSNGKLYVILFSALASKWGDYQPLVEASVNTFAVKG
jgi:hypothetical protein